MWGLRRSGIEPVSPAVATGFFITEPPGSPDVSFYMTLKAKTTNEKVGKLDFIEVAF